MVQKKMPNRKRSKKQKSSIPSSVGTSMGSLTLSGVPSSFSSVSTSRKSVPNVRPRPRARRAQPVRAEDKEWFVLYTKDVRATDSTGVLFSSILHPVLFPATPYYARCVNFTHRVERRWEFEIMITAALTTGIRVAAVPIDDPSPTPNMSAEIAYQQVANGRAALAAVSGTVDTKARIPMVSSTARLSNSSPMALSSLVGFSSGTIFLFLLDTPMGVSDAAVVKVTLLGRVSLSEQGPFTGFMSYESQSHDKRTVSMAITDITATVQFETHVGGSGYLDGNTYMAVMSEGKDPTGVTFSVPKLGFQQIYTSLPGTKAAGWRNVDEVAGFPVYFTVAVLSQGNAVLVGWMDLQQARTFLIAPHSVTSGSAYGVDNSKKWIEVFSLTETTGKGTVYFTPLGQMGALLAGRPFHLPPKECMSSAHSLSSSMSSLNL